MVLAVQEICEVTMTVNDCFIINGHTVSLEDVPSEYLPVLIGRLQDEIVRRKKNEKH